MDAAITARTNEDGEAERAALTLRPFIGENRCMARERTAWGG